MISRRSKFLYLINILSGLFISLFILISWLGGCLVQEPFIGKKLSAPTLASIQHIVNENFSAIIISGWTTNPEPRRDYSF